jgi:hypothetical protein
MISILFINQTHAQSFFPFSTAQTAYYNSESGIFALAPHDSSVNTWPKQYTFKPAVLPSNYVNPDIYRCAVKLNASLLGLHVLNYGDSLFEFYNSFNHPISLLTQTSVGESWLAYSDTNATVTFMHTRDSLILDDTLQVIDITVNYHNTVYTPQTFSPILLAAKAGLVSFPPFYSFPFSLFLSSSIAPKQLNRCDNSVHNITWDSIYNYQVGDELHVENVNNDPTKSITTKTIYEIKEQLVRTPDSICYKTLRYVSIIYLTPDSTGNSFKIDTFYLAHKRLSSLDKEPGVYANVGRPNIVVQTPHGLGKSNYLPTTLSLPTNYQDTCGFLSFESADYVYNYVYLNGLGGPYGEFSFGSGSNRNYNTLQFYKKGNKTWGVPFSKSVGLAAIQELPIANIYPNPTQGLLTISLTTPEQTQFTLFDVLGRVQLTQELHTHQTEINLSHLPKGVYYYTVANPQQNSTGKLVIK